MAATLDLPKGVEFGHRRGAIVKFSDARIGVGSVSPTVDVSDASLQVLGRPTSSPPIGTVARDVTGAIIPGSVFFTSINDSTVGMRQIRRRSRRSASRRLGWNRFSQRLGFCRRIAPQSRTGRRLPESHSVRRHALRRWQRFDCGTAGRGFADRYGGHAGNDHQFADHRQCRCGNGGDPDTFAETVFTDPVYQSADGFTPDYSRIGPRNCWQHCDRQQHQRFVRTSRHAHRDVLETIHSSARFDDTDITHVLAENLIIDGTAGGAIVQTTARQPCWSKR